ncbi:MAG TPA: hypothetical protein VNG29_01520 [Candidatus Paceibacterota bacterium]|nr:hypothetical protein [Candidatus Paceibacterota bacterium]
MKLHWPLFRVILAALASFGAYAALPWTPRHALSWHVFWSSGFMAMFALGWFGYYLLFEWCWHRFIMHYRFGFRRPAFLATFLRHSREQHVEHHRMFYGWHFISRDAERLRGVVSPVWLFPSLFAVHYLVFRFVLGFSPAPLFAFLAGVTGGYIFFETAHWCAHVPTALDDMFGKIPGVASLWQSMRKHHRDHHEKPDCNFNFSFPWPWDLAMKTFKRL